MNKKQIRKRLTSSLASAIRKLGLLKPGKKIDKIIGHAAAKIAVRVSEALKRSDQKAPRKRSVKKKSASTERQSRKRATPAAN